MNDTSDYVAEWVLSNPSFATSSSGAIGAQIVACAEKGWLTMYYDPADGKYENKSLTLTRLFATVPQDASLGERTVLEALFGAEPMRETQTLKPYKHRRLAMSCWSIVRRGMSDAGMLERENETAYQKKRFLRVGIAALIVGALAFASTCAQGPMGIVATVLAVLVGLIGLYFLVRPRSWQVAEGYRAARDKVLDRNNRVIYRHKEEPVSLPDALAASVPYFANPPLHEVYAERPSWFSSTPAVEAEVGGGFFIAVPLLFTVFSNRPSSGGRTTAGSG